MSARQNSRSDHFELPKIIFRSNADAEDNFRDIQQETELILSDGKKKAEVKTQKKQVIVTNSNVRIVRI